jgi:hypothetical protein
MWFWSSAGVNLDLLNADLLEGFGARDPESMIRVRVVKGFTASRGTSPHVRDEESANLPTCMFSHPASVIGLRLSRRLPWTVNEIIVLVDRAVSQPRYLSKKLTAVFFSNLPVSLEIILEAHRSGPINNRWDQSVHFVHPRDSKELLERQYRRSTDRAFYGPLREKNLKRIREASLPGPLIGHLRVIRASDLGYLDDDVRVGEQSDVASGHSWCLGLAVQSPGSDFRCWVAITDWQTTSSVPELSDCLDQATLIEGIEISGQVVGWFEAPLRDQIS